MQLSSEYLAGFFDGEGCVRIERVKVKNRHGVYRDFHQYRAVVKIAQGSRKVLDLIRDQFGGGCLTSQDRDARCMRVYSLEFRGPRAERFIRLIEPHSIVKQPELQLALMFIEHVKSFELRGMRMCDRKLQILEERERMYHAMIALKDSTKSRGDAESPLLKYVG